MVRASWWARIAPCEERKWTVETYVLEGPAWLDEPCPGGLPCTTCTADACECSRHSVLVLTCLACQKVREHPLGEPIRFECADPDCGGWVLSARLIGPPPDAPRAGEGLR